MSANNNHNRTLQSLADEDHVPLMSEADIRNLISAAPLPLSSTSSPRITRPTPARGWMWGGIGTAVAAATAVVYFNVGTQDPESVTTSDGGTDVVTSTTSVAADTSVPTIICRDVVTPVGSATVGEGTRQSLRSEGGSGLLASASTRRTDADGSPEALMSLPEDAPPQLAPRTQLQIPDSREILPPPVHLTTEELAKLGIKVTASSIVYTEDANVITIRTSGIVVSAATTPSTAFTPLMVTMYGAEGARSSWIDRSDKRQQDLSARQMRANVIPTDTRKRLNLVNELFYVRVDLRDPSNRMFPDASVLLWFEGTEDLLERLNMKKSQIQEQRPQQIGTRLANASVFPNPSITGQAELTFTVSESVETTAEVIDMAGRLVTTLWTNEVLPESIVERPIMGLDNAPSAMYIVVVRTTDGADRLTQRFLIQR